MPGKHKYFLVDGAVLPDVFLKVAEAKQLLAQGKVSSLSKAAEAVGVSRSALYKYKDSIFPYMGTSARQIASIHALLIDEPGVLASLLAELVRSGANVLTINQNIPVDGVAPVSVSIRTEKLDTELETLLDRLKALYGIADIRLLAN